MIDPVISPELWDYALVALFALAMPMWMALHTLPKLRALPDAQIDQIRPRIYLSAMVSHWMMTAAALSPLLIGKADMNALGLGFPTESLPRVALALTLVLVAGLYIYVQRKRVMAIPEGRELVRGAVKRIGWIMPKTQRERKLWVVVSFHAGVCEELFFRGYLLALLNYALPFWAAALIAATMFGFGHMYQGVKGMLATAVVGGVMIGLYVLSGSLWVSMLAHTVYDIHGGEFGRWALMDDERRNATA